MTSTVFIDKTTVIEATWLNDVNAATYVTHGVSTFTGDGAQLVFAVPLTYAIPLVTIQGVVQNRASYTIAGTVLTFSEAPPYGTSVEFTF